MFVVHQNYLKPFNASKTINYSVTLNAKSEAANVKIVVFDILGREVATLVNKEQNAGNYSVKFDASKLTSGIYFCTMESGNFIQTMKLLLMK